MTNTSELSLPELRVDVLVPAGTRSSLASDVLAGLVHRPRHLPPKHFYDARGSALFDAICDLPEYYPTRTEQRLLERIVDEVLEVARPTTLVELGSGAARKTRTLLEAMLRRARPSSPHPTTFVPIDVSEAMLRQSAKALRRDYPRLHVHGLVADYDQGLRAFPSRGRTLVAFLGSSIGNFERGAAIAFLRRVRDALRDDEHLLLGLDLVKDVATLETAYDDAAGVTAEFNRNVLAVLRRELGADVDPSSFRHVAFFDAERSRVEMHLESIRDQRVRIAALDLELCFEAGERIHTEISTKYTREAAESMLAEAGLALARWDEEGPVPGDPAWREGAPFEPWFALALARPNLSRS
jgi:L-histidine N-alpha-methyltransferase